MCPSSVLVVHYPLYPHCLPTYSVNMSVRNNLERPNTQTLDFYRGLSAGVFNRIFAKTETGLSGYRARFGMDHVFPPKTTLPEFQILDLTGNEYKIETLALGDCYDQRKIYPYMYQVGGTGGRKIHTRKLSQRERHPYSVPDLVVKDGRKLYVDLRCSICGTQRRIIITERNQGRMTPICKHLNTEQEHKQVSQIYYVKSVKRQRKANA